MCVLLEPEDAVPLEAGLMFLHKDPKQTRGLNLFGENAVRLAVNEPRSSLDARRVGRKESLPLSVVSFLGGKSHPSVNQAAGLINLLSSWIAEDLWGPRKCKW